MHETKAQLPSSALLFSPLVEAATQIQGHSSPVTQDVESSKYNNPHNTFTGRGPTITRRRVSSVVSSTNTTNSKRSSNSTFRRPSSYRTEEEDCISHKPFFGILKLPIHRQHHRDMQIHSSDNPHRIPTAASRWLPTISAYVETPWFCGRVMRRESVVSRASKWRRHQNTVPGLVGSREH